MHRLWITALILIVSVVSVTPIHAQRALTIEQRIADLNQIASLYAKNYAPYEWKRDALGFDLMDLTPWLQRIYLADDLEFQEALIEYVASLKDAHDSVSFPTVFSASLPMNVDIYDGKVLIEALSTTTFPGAARGDELVSLDGQPVQELIRSFRKYSAAGNPISADRLAATRVVFRPQQIMPHAFRLAETAVVVIRLASTGAEVSYRVTWSKQGIPIDSQGPVPSPGRSRFSQMTEAASEDEQRWLDARPTPTPFQHADDVFQDDTLPSYMRPIQPLLNASVSKDYYAVTNVGSRTPIYAPPPGFVQRLGGATTDFFISGTYVSGGVRIGLIRIPSMSPPNVTLALQQLDQEIAYFNTNTDGLVIDVMRNPGGLVSFVEALAQRFIPTPFRTLGFEIRATANWVASFASQLTLAQLTNAPPDIVQNLRNNFNEVFRAYNENRGRSAPVSLNSTGSLTLAPAAVTYNKPLIVMVDEFSISGADMFPAIIQDNRRGPIFGMRTMGAGGSVVSYNASTYSEGFTRVTVSLMNRAAPISTGEYPAAPYVENIGVRPDIVQNFMTRANLVGAGQPFIQAFTAAIVNLVQSGASSVSNLQ